MTQIAGFGPKVDSQDRAIIFVFSLCYSNCPVCRYSGATKGSFIQQGRLASATQAGAGAGSVPGAGAHQPGSGRGELSLAGDGQAWFWLASADSSARCLCRPCPRPHPGPACTVAAGSSTPTALMCVAPAPVQTIPMKLRTAPDNLLRDWRVLDTTGNTVGSLPTTS